ncbi:MBL fold metallo-hydrolase [Pseudomonas sp. PNP]|uniref:MBL fold metallo-hydrolase n=1 Tax=Pseudomonas sp. PNP TaxID=361819 RepID=UPI001AED08A1|nr:MBL fold metallo-hydrolase [Pseudomonas sp. PNP]MBP2839310.1 MBL fold metallo-hydrolase [Pseudomonas sp. PNP]
MALDIVRTQVGAAEICQIIELEIGQHLAWLLPDTTPDNIRAIEWLNTPYRNPDYSLNALSQCFIIKIRGRMLVVDTCIGNDKTVSEISEWDHLSTDFLEALERAGIDREQVTDVLCTHLHIDHVGWNTCLHEGKWLPTFPNAQYHFAREEYEHWLEEARREPQAMHSISLSESILPVVQAGLVNLIEAPADLGDGISILPTPGHTCSHIAVMIDTGNQQLIIAGDAFHHPCQIARPEWASIGDHDQLQSTTTREQLLLSCADTSTLIAGIHFSVPSFGRVVADEDGKYFFKPLPLK